MTRVDLEAGDLRERIIEAIRWNVGVYVGNYGLSAELEYVEEAADAIISLLREGGEEEGRQTHGEAQCGVGQQADLTDQGGEP